MTINEIKKVYFSVDNRTIPTLRDAFEKAFGKDTWAYDNGMSFYVEENGETTILEIDWFDMARWDLAQKAGKIKSERKAKASRENGKLGGRPRKSELLP